MSGCRGRGHFSRTARRCAAWTARLGALLLLLGGALTARPVLALDPLVLGTNWVAEAEHGGFYQAQATGLYRKYGLDVTIRMGGPQVNGLQLLSGGVIDLWMGYDFQTLKAISAGMPLVTVAAFFQKDPQAILAHPDVKRWEDLRGRPLFVSSAAEMTYWPWLKARFGLEDGQKRPYAFDIQPFLADPNSAQQAYVTSEPYALAMAGLHPTTLLLADAGYPPYANTMVVLRQTATERPSALARFVKASALGWLSYLDDPRPGNALIKKDNPAMSDAQLAFSVTQLRRFGLVTGGDAARHGMGVMSDARWKKTSATMVRFGLLPATLDWHQAWTARFIADLPRPALH